MEFSRFGTKFTARTGILSLMEEMASAMEGGPDALMLGGGNPAHIPEVNALWRHRMAELLANQAEFDRMLVNYDSPQGKTEFLDALAELLNRQYGWPLTARNIAITNGSQSAFFFLFNLFAGRYRDGSVRRILFPLVPEYIGYADQSLHREDFVGRRARISQTEAQKVAHRFKYRVDFDTLAIDKSIAALCVSRPTNPSGNVLTDSEVRQLAIEASKADIPFIIDNAYGLPFPGIIFTEATPYWDPNVVLCMSLSKLGLPTTRTGIIVAQPKIIEAISAMNAIASLANGSIGQVLTLPMVKDGSIITLGRDIIRPFYQSRSQQTQEWIDGYLGSTGVDFAIHQSEGAIFLWIWFKNLPVSTEILYQRLKSRKVVVVPGSFFFFGDDESLDSPGHISMWQHRHECLRLSYAQEPEMVRRGIEIMAEEVKIILKML